MRIDLRNLRLDNRRRVPNYGVLNAGGGSTPWTPSDITTALWLDADDASTITEDVGVSVWADKSTVGTRDVAQATGADQPSYNATAKAVEFNGTSHYLCNSSTFMYAQGAASVYMVAKAPAQSNATFLMEGASSSNTPYYNFQSQFSGFGDTSTMSAFIRNDTNVTLLTQTDLSPAGTLDDTPKILMWNDTGSAMTARVNGGTTTPQAYTRSGSLTVNNFCLGATSRTTVGNFCNMAVNEIVITDGTEDTATRQLIEGYLAWKWDGINGDTALVTALPIGHPYKSAPPTA